MAESADADERRDETHLGAQLQVNCPLIEPILEYCIGVNSYRDRRSSGRFSDSDLLMDFVVLYPAKALTFVKGAILCGVIMNIFLYIPESVIGGFVDPGTISWSRVVWWWLIINKVLQLLQIPIRLLFLYILGRLRGRSNQEIMYCMSVLTTCRIWCWSKRLTVLNYMWYGIGFAISRKPHLRHQPWLNSMAIYVLCIIVLRVILTFTLFYYAFPPAPSRHVHKPPSKANLKGIPVRIFKEAGELKSTLCGICLDDFEAEDKLRVLQCLHGYHVACIDAWLSRSSACPLCMTTIE